MKADLQSHAAATAAHGTIDGTAYAVIGTGSPVVLIHGVGMAQEVWAPQVAYLARTHQVIVYDMLGHGASQDPRTDASLADYAQQLADLLTHLQIEQAAVVGHSMGALVAIEFALRHPTSTLCIVALNAVFMRSPDQVAAVLTRLQALHASGAGSTLDASIARWFGDPVPKDLQAHAAMVRNLLTQVHPQGYAIAYGIFARADAMHRDALAQLRLPALFATGKHDPNSTPAMSLAMAQRAPQGTYTCLDRARHMMTLTSADTVNQCLEDFLATHAPSD